MQNPSPEPQTKEALMETVAELRRQLDTYQAKEAECHQSMQALSQRQETFRILLDESSDPIFMFYPDGTYRYVNRAFADGVGHPQDEIIGHKIWDVFSQDEADKRYAAVKWVFEHGQTRVIEVRVPRPDVDGDHYYITTVKPIKDEQGQVISVICISKEITDRKRMEQELIHLSTYDLLTGVYNRNFFETEIKRIQDSRMYPVSIVMVDLNHLKIVNDTYGHPAGDDLIRKAAQVLKESFRSEDIIARYGGDEFVVLLPEMDKTATLFAVARLRDNVKRLSDPHLSLSIGWATGTKGCQLTGLLREADDNMYREKANQRR